MLIRSSRVESEDWTTAARDRGGAGVVRLLLEEAGPGVDAGGGERELPFDIFPFMSDA